MATGKIETGELLNNDFHEVPLNLYNMTGTIVNWMTYRLYKNVFEFGGSARVSTTARTGGNPGFYFYIPNNRELVSTFSLFAGTCLCSG